jgi:predicted  nucleic acid-binding Zn-ribbon protein
MLSVGETLMRVRLYTQLQLLDQRLAALSQTARALAEQLGEGDAVRELYELRRERSSQLKHERGRASDLQWELDEIEARLRELGAQEREGPSDPLVARELAILRDRRGQIEDQALAQMERVDQAVSELTDADTTWRERSAAWAAREPELLRQWEAIAESLEARQSERQTLLAQLPAGAAALYDDLQRRYQGTAIASIRNRHCAACRARLPDAVFDLLAGPDPLVRCPRCGRVLAPPTGLDEHASDSTKGDMEQPDELA